MHRNFRVANESLQQASLLIYTNAQWMFYTIQEWNELYTCTKRKNILDIAIGYDMYSVPLINTNVIFYIWLVLSRYKLYMRLHKINFIWNSTLMIRYLIIIEIISGSLLPSELYLLIYMLNNGFVSYLLPWVNNEISV